MEVKKYRRYWAVYDDDDNLICVTVYKKGAMEVKRQMDRLLKQINEEKDENDIVET